MRRPVLGLLAGLGSVLLLAACSGASDPAQLTDAETAATATVQGCYPYGSVPHAGPPTATVTGTPPTATRTPTPTRPPRDCDFCTQPPRPTRTVAAWPAPAVTCLPAPGQATSTSVPTPDSPLFPTPVAPTAQPALLGVGEAVQFGNLEGEAQPGGVAVDPRSGAAWIIWTQISPDANQATAGRVYTRHQLAAGGWSAPRAVQAPGQAIGRESAVAVTSDGTVIVAWVYYQGDTAFIGWRASTDGGATWSAPATLADAGVADTYNLRLTADPAGGVHLAAIAKTGGDGTGGDVLYYEWTAGSGWHGQRRPVDRGGRQYNLAVASFALRDTTIRTVLLWNEDQHAYTATRDGAGPWSAPARISGNYPPMADYQPGGLDHSMQLLAFPWQDTTALFATYSSYSTGYLAAFWSTDGGATWSPESAIGYNPHDGTEPGTVHNPIPYWDGAGHVAIAYQFCQAAEIAGERTNCFAAFAYAAPGTAGPDWTGYEDNRTPPLRLFAPTQAGSAATFRGAGGAASYAWLLWQEQNGSRELRLAPIDWHSLLQIQEGSQP